MDRLSPLDASFLHIEDGNPNCQMHVGSIGIFEGPVPDHDDVRTLLRSRLHLLPRYRQVVRTVPGGIGRPVWVDQPGFSLDYHLRRTALPAPGDDDALRTLVGRIMSQRLDRTKPLWEIWVVEGLADGTWAMVSKIHHAMIDGVSGAEMMAIVLDLSPEVASYDEEPWDPDPEPNDVQLVADAVKNLATSTYEQTRVLGRTFRRRHAIADQAREVARGLTSMAGIVAPAEHWSLIGQISAHREWTWASTTMADVKVIREQFGGSVNDVVLAAITNGFREVLVSRGEDVTDHVVRTLVPVSVRATRDDGAATSDGTMDNKVSAMFANLPVGIDDPIERLDAIREQMTDLKESKQAVAGEALTSTAGFAPPAMLALATRYAARFAGSVSNLHTVTTNVPGPQFPLYSLGRRMVAVMPYVPLTAPLRTGVAIFSYDGKVTFGITGDVGHTDDIDVLARGIEGGLTELLKLASSPT
ncbi:MAG: wax ester/triacylglycerol synthase family O-acyltransferase [Actinobacteria bacterium]|nr:wax ester/triacylglycerol synthase family O-acyltransferase [Actinomycetota bacterium]